MKSFFCLLLLLLCGGQRLSADSPSPPLNPEASPISGKVAITANVPVEETKYLTVEALLTQNQKENWGTDPEQQLNHLLSLIEEIIKQYPNTPASEKAYYARAQAIRNVTDLYHQREEHLKARTIYARLVGYQAVGLKEPEGKETDPIRQIASNDPAVLEYLNRGEELFSKRSYLFSLQQYQTFIDLNPNHKRASEAQYFVGVSLAGLTKYEKAVAELQKVAVNYPASQWADKALERAATYTWQDLKDPKEALKIYEKILTDYPDSSSVPLVQYLVGGVYCALNDFTKARLAYQEVIDKYPGTDLFDGAERGLAEIKNK